MEWDFNAEVHDLCGGYRRYQGQSRTGNFG